MGFATEEVILLPTPHEFLNQDLHYPKKTPNPSKRVGIHVTLGLTRPRARLSHESRKYLRKWNATA